MGDISKLEKAQGALLASAIGDALGWPYEFNSGNQSCRNYQDYRFVSWKRKNRSPFWHVETIEKGNYSDDTQLMLAVARSLLSENWMKTFTDIEYPFWLKYERGAGRAVKRAASLWEKGVVPWQCREYRKDYFMAGGNGGAMRILPHVIKNQDDNIGNIIDDVIADVIISHGHPRAILGATCYSYALYYLLNKQDVLSFAELVDILIEERKIWGAAPNQDRFFDWLEVAQNESGYNYSVEWNNCYTNMIKGLDYVKQALNDGLLSDDKIVLENIGAYSNVCGAGDIAVLTAVYFFSKYVNTPELAISVPAFSVGLDTDTIASMTGGLIGSFCGIDWIPLEWKSIQDYSYICSVANDLCEDKHAKIEKKRKITSFLADDIQQMKVVDSVNIESKYSTLKITEYRTVFGQTIYIKSINRRTETNSVSKPIDKEGSIKISIKEIESILKDEALRRITLKKALDIVWLKYQGEDEKKIVKQVRVDKSIVSKVLLAFQQK